MTINETIEWLEYQFENLEAERKSIDPMEYAGSDSNLTRNAVYYCLKHMKDYEKLLSKISWERNPDLMGRY